MKWAWAIIEDIVYCICVFGFSVSDYVSFATISHQKSMKKSPQESERSVNRQICRIGEIKERVEWFI